MLQKQNRLTKRKEFGFIYKNGKKVHTNALVVVFVPTKLGFARFGFVVGKKCGKAHVRNKIKRQLREIVRRNLSQFSAKYNYVFVVKPEFVALSFAQMTEMMLSLANKVVLKGKE